MSETPHPLAGYDPGPVPDEPPTGTKFYWPADDELLIDLDGADAVQEFVRRLTWTKLPVVGLRLWPSRHKGMHAVVTLQGSHHEAARIIMQAGLGSDKIRETLSLFRLAAGRTGVTVLFKPLEAA